MSSRRKRWRVVNKYSNGKELLEIRKFFGLKGFSLKGLVFVAGLVPHYIACI